MFHSHNTNKDLYVQLRNDIDNHPAFNGMMLTAAVGIGIDKIYETEGAVGGPFGEITPPSYDVPHLSAHVSCQKGGDHILLFRSRSSARPFLKVWNFIGVFSRSI